MSRKPFQGVAAVVRFNWHFYLGAAVVLAVLLVAATVFSGWLAVVFAVVAAGVALTTLLSLAATFLAYDASPLYRLDWLGELLPERGEAANIHAGFDETSCLLRARFPAINWRVYDFYDPAKHTELSIRRARKAHPPDPTAIVHSTDAFPAGEDAFDAVLLTLAAHEIRGHRERVNYFGGLRRSLKPGGLIVVTEHLRDARNLAAYNLGAFHFHTAGAWLRTFQDAGLAVRETFSPAPFITTFVLVNHANHV